MVFGCSNQLELKVQYFKQSLSCFGQSEKEAAKTALEFKQSLSCFGSSEKAATKTALEREREYDEVVKWIFMEGFHLLLCYIKWIFLDGWQKGDEQRKGRREPTTFSIVKQCNLCLIWSRNQELDAYPTNLTSNGIKFSHATLCTWLVVFWWSPMGCGSSLTPPPSSSPHLCNSWRRLPSSSDYPSPCHLH